MTETKHTPGPWHYDAEDGWIYCQQAALTAYVIATMETGHEADARLIAAAPEMLQLLLEMDRRIVWEYAGMDRDFQERVEAVLAKAGADQ